MTLNLDRSAWQKVRFGDVVRQVKASTDPVADGVKRYVAGEHMDSDSLAITRWGMVGDGYLGPAFHRKFTSGQVLYGSRRTYLRKVALADFDGVCANTTFVMESADKSRLLPELLPFVMSTEDFHAHSIAESKGSVNPYVNWPDIAKFEFDLPPLDQQRRIADLMGAIEADKLSVQTMSDIERALKETWLSEVFGDRFEDAGRTKLDSWVVRERPICYGVLKPGPEFAGGPMIIDVKDYPRGEVDVAAVRRCDPKIESGFTRSRLRTGDVLLSIRGTIGRVALVPKELDGANISRDSARIAIDGEIAHPRFVKALLESKLVQQQMTRRTTGLAVKGLNVAVIRDLDVPMLSLQQQDVLLAELDRLDGLLDALDRRASSLSALRRALLYELFGSQS